MKLLQSIILALCISMPLAQADPFTITTQIPQSDLNVAVTNALRTMLNGNAANSISQNTPWFLGGAAVVGFIGFDMIRKSIHTMVDKRIGLNNNESDTYTKLIAKTTIGAFVMGAAGIAIKALLK